MKDEKRQLYSTSQSKLEIVYGLGSEDWADHISKAWYEAQGPLSVMNLGYNRRTVSRFFTLDPSISRALEVSPHPSQGEFGIIIKSFYSVPVWSVTES